MTDDFTPAHALLSAHRRDGDRVRFDVPADWLQGRTAYGGLIAAMGTQAMRVVTGDAWPPTLRLRALQTNFIGPVVAGPAEVAVTVLREGKSVRQIQATVKSEGLVAATLVGVYGSPRTSALDALAPTQQALRVAAADAPSRPFVAGLMPAFLQHLHIGWAAGDPPGSGGKGWQTGLYLRLVGDRADLIDRDVLTVLLADAPPSPAVGHFRQLAAASSVCWALELLPDDAPVGTDDWWRIDTVARSAADGYVNHSSTLWNSAGQAVAFGHQMVTVYG